MTVTEGVPVHPPLHVSRPLSHLAASGHTRVRNSRELRLTPQCSVPAARRRPPPHRPPRPRRNAPATNRSRSVHQGPAFAARGHAAVASARSKWLDTRRRAGADSEGSQSQSAKRLRETPAVPVKALPSPPLPRQPAPPRVSLLERQEEETGETHSWPDSPAGPGSDSPASSVRASTAQSRASRARLPCLSLDVIPLYRTPPSPLRPTPGSRTRPRCAKLLSARLYRLP